MKRNFLFLTFLLASSIQIFAGKPIYKETSPLSVVESEEKRASWCEKDGFTVVENRTLHYWLYDSYKFHNGDIYELLYEIVPKWFESMGYVASPDYIISSPNLILADSVKKLMLENNCDVSILFDDDMLPHVVVNSYDKENDIYSFYFLGEQKISENNSVEETISYENSNFKQHEWYEDPPYIKPEGYDNLPFVPPLWYIDSRLNSWKEYLNKKLSSKDLQILIKYIDNDITERKKEYPNNYSLNKWTIRSYENGLKVRSDTVAYNFSITGSMSDTKLANLITEALNSANYSKQQLTIMDFNSESTRTIVETKLNEWKIKYDRYFAGDGNEVEEIIYNTFGAGSTIAYNVKWMGIAFEEIEFHYAENNKLAYITMHPDESITIREIKDFFNILTRDYPTRKTISYDSGLSLNSNAKTTILIKNGSSENESAVLETTDSIGMANCNFFFQGHQLMIYDEW